MKGLPFGYNSEYNDEIIKRAYINWTDEHFCKRVLKCKQVPPCQVVTYIKLLIMASR